MAEIIKVPKKYQSLVSLLKNEESEKNTTPQQRRKSYWENTLRIEIPIPEGIVQGSGLMLTKDGYFITNQHVLNVGRENYSKMINQEIKVRPASFSDSQFYFRLEKICVLSKKYDLAIGKLNCNGQPIPNVVFAITEPKQENPICIYGYKNEVMEERKSKITTIGYFKDKTLHEAAKLVGENNIFDLDNSVERHSYTSEAEVEPGWSGGPVVKYDTGELIGITSSLADFSKDENVKMVKQFQEQSKTDMSNLLTERVHIFTSYKKVIDIIKIYLNTKRVN
jgi:V8-like Glu-specific endopeptidase